MKIGTKKRDRQSFDETVSPFQLENRVSLVHDGLTEIVPVVAAT